MRKMPLLEITFQIFNFVFLIILCLLTLYPFIHLVSVSFSTNKEAIREGLHIIPREISLDAYRAVFSSDIIYSAYFNSIFRTVVGTVLKLFFTLMTAYGLSKSWFPFRKIWIKMLVLAMIFHAGLVPNYLLVRSLKLIDSRWSLILPSLMSVFDIIILINFLRTIPVSLEESAYMDGANDFIILFYIIVPLSLPVTATIGLWSAVGHWNAFFDAVLYINSTDKYVLQILLRKLLLEQRMLIESGNVDNMTAIPVTIQAATVIVATLPILLSYPFAQKYFVKGVKLGSIKE